MLKSTGRTRPTYPASCLEAARKPGMQLLAIVIPPSSVAESWVQMGGRHQHTAGLHGVPTAPPIQPSMYGICIFPIPVPSGDQNCWGQLDTVESGGKKGQDPPPPPPPCNSARQEVKTFSTPILKALKTAQSKHLSLIVSGTRETQCASHRPRADLPLFLGFVGVWGQGAPPPPGKKGSEERRFEERHERGCSHRGSQTQGASSLGRACHIFASLPASRFDHGLPGWPPRSPPPPAPPKPTLVPPTNDTPR